MTGIIVLIRIFIVIGIVGLLVYLIARDYDKKHGKKALESTSLDEIEKESIDILNKKQEIRGVTDQTQKQIDNINQNLKS